MPKLPHKFSNFHAVGSYYHLVLRGNRREALFSTAADRRALNAIAIDALQRFDATLHAYCLMPNHFRILVQIDDRLLIKALKRIVTRYSRHRQRLSKSAEPLFERPYEAQRIDTHGDFLNLLRSIHLSPVMANSVVVPDDYRWSSHRAYLGYKSVTWINTDFGLSLLAADRAQARVVYPKFIAAGIADADNLRKSRTVADNSFSNQLPSNQSLSSTAGAEAPPSSTSFSSINSRIQLPSASKPALPRFGRKHRRTSHRRFLSIY